MKKTSKADNCDNSEDERQQSLSTVWCAHSPISSLYPVDLVWSWKSRTVRPARNRCSIFSKLFLLPSSNNSGQCWWISVSPVDLIWSWTSRNAGGQVADKEIDLPMSKDPLLTNSLSLFSFTVDKFFFFIKVSFWFLFALFLFNNIFLKNNSFLFKNTSYG